MASRTLVLTEADVREALTLDELIPALETALVEFSSGAAQQPLRTVLGSGKPPTWFGFMPAIVPGVDAVGAKIVSVCPPAPDVEFTHKALIVLLDKRSGACEALMDGRYITELRTAAVSEIAAAHLATRPIRRLGIFGAGIQARSHLEVFARRHRLAEVRVWSPSARRHAFAEWARSGAKVDVLAVERPRDAAVGMDAIALVTAATDPVLEDAWVAPGTVILAVGSCRPTQREMARALVAHARLYVDSRVAALSEAGDIVQSIAVGDFGPEHIVGEIGDVIAGRVPAPAPDDPRPIVFKSLGLGVEDVAAARLAFDRARERGVGHYLTL